MAPKQKPKKTWKYPDSFKLKAIKLSKQDGVKVKDVAEMLDIHPFMLSRWRKEYREGKIKNDNRMKVTSIQKEKSDLNRILRLEKENARLKQENKLLKKWQRFLAEQHQNDLDSSRETGN
jgi:transposase